MGEKSPANPIAWERGFNEREAGADAAGRDAAIARRAPPAGRNPISAAGGSGASPVEVHIGTRLRLRRQALSMTQADLAEALGISFQQVQKYESAGSRISASRLYQVARVLDVPPGFFFAGLEPDGERVSRDPIGAALVDRRARDLMRAYGALERDALRQAAVDLLTCLARKPRSAPG